MRELWHVRIHMEVEPGDLGVDSSNTKGYMNVLTWATSAQEAIAKIADYLSTFDWVLLEVEEATTVDFRWTYEPEMKDSIQRASGNPDAIILGTFHSYPEPIM